MGRYRRWVLFLSMSAALACSSETEENNTTPKGKTNNQTLPDMSSNNMSSPDMTSSADMASDLDMTTAEDMSGDQGADQAADMAADMGLVLVGGCSAQNPAACGYTPDSIDSQGPKREVDFSYQDSTGTMRAFRGELRAPQDPEQGAGLVIWSHGGASGIANPDGVAVEWGRAFNRAGYYVLAIAHAPRAMDYYPNLCEDLMLTECGKTCTMDEECTAYEGGGCAPQGDCRYFKELNWDRPHDLGAVLNWVDQQTEAGGMLEGRVDPAKIAYAGHSAGAGSTMMVNGATRVYGEVEQAKVEPRIAALLSFSPQGPGDDGFDEDSFDGTGCRRLLGDQGSCWSRPHLFATGAGDDTSVVAENRALGARSVQGADKYVFWLGEEAARHTTFNLSNDSCARHARQEGLDETIYPERCDDYLRWLRSYSVAFLDAYLGGDAEALAYLRSDNIRVMSQMAVELQRR